MDLVVSIMVLDIVLNLPPPSLSDEDLVPSSAAILSAEMRVCNPPMGFGARQLIKFRGAHLNFLYHMLACCLLHNVLARLCARKRPLRVAFLKPRFAKTVARVHPLLVQMLHAHNFVTLIVHLADSRRRLEQDLPVPSLSVPRVPQ